MAFTVDPKTRVRTMKSWPVVSMGLNALKDTDIPQGIRVSGNHWWLFFCSYFDIHTSSFSPSSFRLSSFPPYSSFPPPTSFPSPPSFPCLLLILFFLFFLDAFSHLYRRVCPSVHRSVHPSVCTSLCDTRVEFLKLFKLRARSFCTKLCRSVGRSVCHNFLHPV